VRCPRCGNENPGTNRFCGMCGATLQPAPTAGSTTQSVPVAPAPQAPVAAQVPTARVAPPTASRAVVPATPTARVAPVTGSQPVTARPAGAQTTAPPGTPAAPVKNPTQNVSPPAVRTQPPATQSRPAPVPASSAPTQPRVAVTPGRAAVPPVTRNPGPATGSVQVAPTPAAPVAAPVAPTAAVPSQAPIASAQPGPVISGPSFLGLDKVEMERAPAAPARELNLRPEPQERTSGNLDYLLEDDEERKSGAWKVVLIVVALALAGGFGYLRMRNGGLDWLTAGPKKPAATTSDSTGTGDAANTDSPASNGASNTAQPATGAGAQGPPASASNTPASTQPAASNNPGNPSAGSAIEPVPVNPPAGKNRPDTSAGPSPASPAPTSDDEADSDTPAAAPVKPKPVAKPPAAKPVDAVTEAEKYIYGKGVPQNCDRGMKILRPAAEHSNPRAMASLGILYSAGLCTGRDIPTGYRWIALALRREPDNQVFKDDLQKLWSEMTQPERQLAIKLSQ
jgi:zinc-ribbon domain